jgi:hypothetical protein
MFGVIAFVCWRIGPALSTKPAAVQQNTAAPAAVTPSPATGIQN